MMSIIESKRLRALEDQIAALEARLLAIESRELASDAAYDIPAGERRKPGRPRKQESAAVG
jgi:hypothetical protein